MARQIPELDELRGNQVAEEDLMIIRDASAKQDKRISVKELSQALGGGGGGGGGEIEDGSVTTSKLADKAVDTSKIADKAVTTAKIDMKALLDVFYPVGSYYETTNNSFDPNVEWGGTWNKTDTAGKFLVGMDANDWDFDLPGWGLGNKTHAHGYGMKFGEYYGYFSVNPKLQNGYAGTWASPVTQSTAENWTETTLTTGSSTKSNTTYTVTANTTYTSGLPPYSVAIRWHRTA